MVTSALRWSPAPVCESPSRSPPRPAAIARTLSAVAHGSCERNARFAVRTRYRPVDTRLGIPLWGVVPPTASPRLAASPAGTGAAAGAPMVPALADGLDRLAAHPAARIATRTRSANAERRRMSVTCFLGLPHR